MTAVPQRGGGIAPSPLSSAWSVIINGAKVPVVDVAVDLRGAIDEIRSLDGSIRHAGTLRRTMTITVDVTDYDGPTVRLNRIVIEEDPY